VTSDWKLNLEAKMIYSYIAACIGAIYTRLQLNCLQELASNDYHYERLMLHREFRYRESLMNKNSN